MWHLARQQFAALCGGRLAVMWLRSVAVDNFRAFRRAEILLPEAGLVLIAGANNTGKTALLSALDVIAGDSGDTTSLRHAGGDGPAQVTARFCLSHDERASVLARSPRREQLLIDGAVAFLDFVFTENELLRRQGQPGLGLTEICGDLPPHGIQTFARLDADGGSGQTSVSVESVLTSDTSTPTLNSRPFGGSSAWLDQLLRSLTDLGSLGELLPGWRARFYHFRALRLGTQRTQALASSHKLAPTGSDLSAVLLYLATDRPDLFGKLRDLIAEIVPHVGRLEVRTGGGQLRGVRLF
jgi:AAA ATPase domain